MNTATSPLEVTRSWRILRKPGEHTDLYRIPAMVYFQHKAPSYGLTPITESEFTHEAPAANREGITRLLQCTHGYSGTTYHAAKSVTLTVHRSITHEQLRERTAWRYLCDAAMHLLQIQGLPDPVPQGFAVHFDDMPEAIALRLKSSADTDLYGIYHNTPPLCHVEVVTEADLTFDGMRKLNAEMNALGFSEERYQEIMRLGRQHRRLLNRASRYTRWDV